MVVADDDRAPPLPAVEQAAADELVDRAAQGRAGDAELRGKGPLAGDGAADGELLDEVQQPFADDVPLERHGSGP